MKADAHKQVQYLRHGMEQFLADEGGAVLCVGCALWMLYGVYLNSFQMVLFNGITLLLNGIILHLIVFSKGNKK